MKTIEATALELARYAYDFDKADKEWLIGNLALMIRNALEEQRAIDIDKACKVIDDLMMAYISGNLSHDEVMDKCRKAMDE